MPLSLKRFAVRPLWSWKEWGEEGVFCLEGYKVKTIRRLQNTRNFRVFQNIRHVV
ncbi:hypothetical protein HMPREF1870_01900 [Bacteroidales bacterium KA00344]|nr:hypothetical protein HMPREF1870_01900 [Bacteroidales bacterium KA00344]